MQKNESINNISDLKIGEHYYVCFSKDAHHAVKCEFFGISEAGGPVQVHILYKNVIKTPYLKEIGIGHTAFEAEKNYQILDQLKAKVTFDSEKEMHIYYLKKLKAEICFWAVNSKEYIEKRDEINTRRKRLYELINEENKRPIWVKHFFQLALSYVLFSFLRLKNFFRSKILL